MNRPWMFSVLAVLLAGCTSGPPPGDPFLLGRSTIPPPATGAIGQANGTTLAPVGTTMVPPAVSVPPAATMPISPAPTMSPVPTLGPAPTGVPPANNPYAPRDGSYNFRQGSNTVPAMNIPVAATPMPQAVTTTNRAALAAPPSTNVAPAASDTVKTSSAKPIADAPAAKDNQKTTVVLASHEEDAETDAVGSASAAQAAPPTTTRLPTSSAIRIVEPQAAGNSDSAATPKVSATMTASSWQPQWQKWTGSATQ